MSSKKIFPANVTVNQPLVVPKAQGKVALIQAEQVTAPIKSDPSGGSELLRVLRFLVGNDSNRDVLNSPVEGLFHEDALFFTDPKQMTLATGLIRKVSRKFQFEYQYTKKVIDKLDADLKELKIDFFRTLISQVTSQENLLGDNKIDKKKIDQQLKVIETDIKEKKKAEYDKLMDLFGGVNKLEPTELALIFYEFKEYGDFKGMTHLYEKSENNVFKDSPTIRELYAVALHKTGRVDESKKEIEKLIQDGYGSGESYAILGKAHTLNYEREKKAGNRDGAMLELQSSIDALKKGYNIDFELYPGINLVYNFITQGLETNDLAKFLKAEKIADMVWLSCKKAGGERSNDYWTLVTMLEAGSILGYEDIHKLLPKVLAKAEVPWEIDSSLTKMRQLLKQTIEHKDKIPDADRKIEILGSVIPPLEDKLLSLQESTEINLVNNIVLNAVESKDMEKLKQAKHLADVVHKSMLGNDESSVKFWTLGKMLETSLLAGDGKKAEIYLRKINNLAPDQITVTALISRIEDLKKYFEKKKDSISHAELSLKLIDLALTRLKANLTKIDRDKNNELAKKTELLFKDGFSFGEIKQNSVGGNIPYGGQLHNRVANRWDFTIARGMISELGLNDTSDYDTFDRTVDKLIRDRFNTIRLKHTDSKEHEEYDNEVKKLLELMGVRKGNDSNTNVMIDFWLGFGDCRSHAEVKQILFDVWKSGNINRLMGKAYEALEKDDIGRFKEFMSGAKKLEQMQMLIKDKILMGNIEMLEKYKPKRDENGRLLYSDQLQPIEDHTYNELIIVDANGKEIDIRDVDSFYQSQDPKSKREYNFGGEFTLPDGANIRGIPVDVNKIKIDSNDNVIAPAGTLLVMKDGKEVPIELYFIDAPYSGDREKRIKPIFGDWGERMSLRGINIDKAQKLSQIKALDFLNIETKDKAGHMLLELLNNIKLKT